MAKASGVAQAWSIVAVVVVAAAFGVMLFCFLPEQNVSGVAAAIFGAAGTIVALALPAAELAGQSITRVADYWLGRFLKPGRRPPSKEVALADIETKRVKARTAQRGSAYVLYAFVLAAFALLTPHVDLGTHIFHAEHALLGLAGGFLLVGAALFFPFAWAVYRLDDLHDAEKFIRMYDESEDEAPPPPPPPLDVRTLPAARPARKTGPRTQKAKRRR